MLCPQRTGTNQLALKLQSPSSAIIPSSLEGEERWVGECQFLHRKKELPSSLEQPIMLCHGARANLGCTKHLTSVKSVLKNVFRGQKSIEYEQKQLPITSNIEILYNFIDHLKIQSIMLDCILCFSSINFSSNLFSFFVKLIKLDFVILQLFQIERLFKTYPRYNDIHLAHAQQPIASSHGQRFRYQTLDCLISHDHCYKEHIVIYSYLMLKDAKRTNVSLLEHHMEDGS